MKRIGTMVSMLVLAGSLTGSAMAANDGVLLKEEAGYNYCHMKFPAIRESTLSTNHPTLKSSTTGDVIDFYGPCDESPTGPEQVAAQRLDEQHRFDSSYND